MTAEREPKEGELYDLKDGEGWCRHGIVLIQRNGTLGLVAVDTYWGGGPNNGCLERNWYLIDDKLKERLTFILDLTTARESHHDEWEIFADEDRANIPMGGGRARWYVRKDARPSYARQVARLERRIQEERSKAESATRWAEGFEKDLQALKDKHVHRPAVMGPCSPECQTCAAAMNT